MKSPLMTYTPSASGSIAYVVCQVCPPNSGYYASDSDDRLEEWALLHLDTQHPAVLEYVTKTLANMVVLIAEADEEVAYAHARADERYRMYRKMSRALGRALGEVCVTGYRLTQARAVIRRLQDTIADYHEQDRRNVVQKKIQRRRDRRRFGGWNQGVTVSGDSRIVYQTPPHDELIIQQQRRAFTDASRLGWL